MAEKRYLTVSALNKYIAYKIDTDIALKNIYIKGELSNVRQSKGHIYFVLKDEESELSGIIFYNVAMKLKFMPKDGMKVLISGELSSYYKKGSYNLIVSEIEEFGKGDIYQKFIELKNKLEQEGLFDSKYKKQLPKFPNTIGVITSQTADALFDIKSTINKRYPLVNIRLYPSLVQGNDAPESLISALKKADEEGVCDVLIIARGGGSFEDLNCFNDENLARTIFKLRTPIVSGVGHEQDYTICDFVCDGRAPTPTGAATLITQDKNVLIKNIESYENNLLFRYNKLLNNKENELNETINRYGLKNFNNIIELYINNIDLVSNKLDSLSPINLLENKNKELENYIKRIDVYNIEDKINQRVDVISTINKAIKDLYNNYIDNQSKEFDYLISKMIDVNPLNIMKKGYTLVYKNEELQTSSKNINNGDELLLKFYDGNINVIVNGEKNGK